MRVSLAEEDGKSRLPLTFERVSYVACSLFSCNDQNSLLLLISLHIHSLSLSKNDSRCALLFHCHIRPSTPSRSPHVATSRRGSARSTQRAATLRCLHHRIDSNVTLASSLAQALYSHRLPPGCSLPWPRPRCFSTARMETCPQRPLQLQPPTRSSEHSSHARASSSGIPYHRCRALRRRSQGASVASLRLLRRTLDRSDARTILSPTATASTPSRSTSSKGDSKRTPSCVSSSFPH